MKVKSSGGTGSGNGGSSHKTKSDEGRPHPDGAFETRCIHAGVKPDPTTGAIMTPIYQTSTYVQSSPGKHKGYEYARTQNPTREAIEASIASLENATYGVAFASGCAATATLIHLLNAGDHVVASDDLYGGSQRSFNRVFSRSGIEFTFVDMRETKNVASAMKKNTKMIWLETPTNPNLKLCDIEEIASIGRKAKAHVVVDNTFASPYFQSPLDLGATIAMHSATKYINGHSDVVMGLVATNSKDVFDQLKFLQNTIGAIPSPHDCFLVLRGVKTLAVRMRQHEKNAMEVASFLEGHKKVKTVIYPGLASHPQHALAKKQMRGFAGMITIHLDSNLTGARRFLENVKIFALAESLGGVESLIEHPAIMTHASVPAETRKALGISDTMIRLSVGLESCSDLIQDLTTALKHV